MLIAGVLFVALLVAGKVLEELDIKAILGFLLIALGTLAAFLAFEWPLVWFTLMLIVLDVVLLLWVFKGDLTIR